jgi:hypothetical protein
MKTRSLITSLFLAGALVLSVAGVRADEKTDAAVVAAKEWLALVDAKEYRKSWQEAALFFKDSVSEKQWEEMVASVRGPLGAMESRVLLGAQFTNSLPGIPAGEYVVIQFKTDFANKPGAIETITPMKAGGAWRVAGYFIR